jgi:hypothetical protein
LGKSLIQYDWHPYKKRKFGHRHAQREDHIKTQGEATERDLRINQPLGTPDFGLPTFQN